MTTRKVLVTGGAGYIGSILVQELLLAGFEVCVYDRFFFGNNFSQHPNLTTVQGDVRNIPENLFSNVFGVLDLAALSNDPSGEMMPTKTLDINYRARRRVQELASSNKVSKYILASSCSVYGFQDGVLDETASVNPLTTYASANLLAEEAALTLGKKGTDMCITILRQATVYGLSPRMRFDLAINGMTLGLYQDGVIPLMRDGSQWRPFVHVRDTSKAFLKVLDAKSEIVNQEIFNVGSDAQNFQILQLAELVAKGLGKPLKYEFYGEVDVRSYRVNFEKIARVLDFRATHNVESAALEISQALDKGDLVPDIRTKTLQWYQELEKWNDRIKQVAPDGFIL
jgi:nucleoside-diphosphate-sugar epimerase